MRRCKPRRSALTAAAALTLLACVPHVKVKYLERAASNPSSSTFSACRDEVEGAARTWARRHHFIITPDDTSSRFMLLHMTGNIPPQQEIILQITYDEYDSYRPNWHSRKVRRPKLIFGCYECPSEGPKPAAIWQLEEALLAALNCG
ncbi:MAG TPA: hypothetical protein VK034_29625 [Enhygromyxa sp.]|nr:hypothetical protein [Enhygromyxa sp.]